MLCFRILGPVEVELAGSVVEIRGRFQRTLLAALLVNAGRVLTPSTLVDELWGERPPAAAENALQAHVSRLRAKLHRAEPGRPVPRLASLPAGYRLLAGADEFDAARFLRTVNEIRARSGLPPSVVVERLREALALWRGPVFGTDLGGFLCQAAAVSYEEHRAAALELLYEQELRLGRHAHVIAELSELALAKSVNERLCALLMVALYRAGRQTDALALYRKVRVRLAAELGIKPSLSLRNLELAILAQDPTLNAAAA
jgi:SARP family transcriptional regulator, regulator of embCAB operon